jgi:hypothetical protein
VCRNTSKKQEAILAKEVSITLSNRVVHHYYGVHLAENTGHSLAQEAE